MSKGGVVRTFAKIILALIIPVFLWVLFNYLGGNLELSDLIKRVIALLAAAYIMYLVSTSR